MVLSLGLAVAAALLLLIAQPLASGELETAMALEPGSIPGVVLGCGMRTPWRWI
jgi:hypothetical protein